MLQSLGNLVKLYRYRKIIDTLEIQNYSAVLDLSCSDGKFLKQLSIITPSLKLFGSDIDSVEIEKAKINLPLANFNNESAEKLNFQDETFNFVFSIMTLHHYKDLHKVLIEIRRVLKTNGVLYFVDLIPKYKLTQKIWNWYGCSQPYHFEKYYTIHDLKTILTPLGYDIVSDMKIASIPRLRILKIMRRQNHK